MPDNTTATAQHTLYPFNNAAGELSGVFSPMDSPFDSLTQWRNYLDTLFGTLAVGTPTENFDGLYVVSFTDGNLLLSRVSRGNAGRALNTLTPEDVAPETLGLLSVITEPDHNVSTLTLALRGGINLASGNLRPDRVLVTVVNTDGATPVVATLDPASAVTARLLGHLMIAALDNNTRLAQAA